MPLAFRPVVLQAADGDLRVEAEIARLAVPVHHADPDGPSWEVAVACLPANTPHPGPPTLLLAGGPGDSAIESLTWNDPGRQAFLAALRQLGDVIALDQRGTGRSWPVPTSTERWAGPLDEPDDPERNIEQALVVCRRLRARWLERGVDVTGFTTEESADDVDLLRRALGAELIRIAGSSYGSHLGFSVIRRHGAHVERALLGLVEGPDHTHKLPSRVQAALEHIAALACEAPELRGAAADLMGDIAELIEALRRHPVTAIVDGHSVTVGAYDLQRSIAVCLGSQARISGLPRRLTELRRGDAVWLAREALDRRWDWVASAMFWHTDAASGASPERRAGIHAEAPETLLGDVINHPFPDVEAAWGSPDLGDAFRAPVASDVPVQFQSGSLDGRTPATNVEDVIGGFSRSGHLVVEGVAHDEGFEVDEARAAMLAFLAGDDPVDLRVSTPFRFDLLGGEDQPPES